MSLPSWIQETRSTVVIPPPAQPLVLPSGTHSPGELPGGVSGVLPGDQPFILPGMVPALPNPLPFTMQPQEQTRWCWAAVSVSVSRYYDPASTVTQCQVAAKVLATESCCANGNSAECDVQQGLGLALSTVAHLRGKVREGIFPMTSTGNKLSLKREIDAGRPVGSRVDNGIGHFVVLYGYDLDDGQEMLDVADPSREHPTYSTYAFGSFAKGYHGGTWTHTYTTR